MKCLRCDKSLPNHNFHYRCECGLQENTLTLQNAWLRWYSDYCLYGTYPNGVDVRTTKLPLLPYTITEDKLKLYLLFS